MEAFFIMKIIQNNFYYYVVFLLNLFQSDLLKVSSYFPRRKE